MGLVADETQAEPGVAELGEPQPPELVRLAASLAELAEAFQAARAAGWAPADALREIGFEVPMFAAPMLNQLVP